MSVSCHRENDKTHRGLTAVNLQPLNYPFHSINTASFPKCVVI